MASSLGTEREALPFGGAPRRAERGRLIEQPFFLRLVSIALFALLWEVAGRIPVSFAFPTFSDTLVAFFSLIADGSLPKAYLSTLQPLILGVVLSTFIGVAVGTMCGLWRVSEWLVIPIFIVLQAAPVAAFIPLVTFIYGIGMTAKTLAVMILALPVIVLNTYKAVRNVNGSLLLMCRSFLGTRRHEVFSIILPDASPVIFAGLRLGVAAGFVGVVLAELLITPTGIGDLITFHRSRADYAEMYATIASIIALSTLTLVALQWIETRVFRPEKGVHDMPAVALRKDTVPMPESVDSIVSVRGISKTYGDVEALRGVDLDFPRGKLTSLLGPSGCGKTTLLKIIAGLIDRDAGTVTVNGKAVSAPGPERAFVFQDFALLPWATVLRNVAFGLELRGSSKAERENKARHYINEVGLSGFENKYPHELSGGMRQRVGLARALAVDADVLLLDEPFSAVDEQNRRKFQEDLISLRATQNKTFIFVTHSIEEAVYISDRIVLLSPRPGRVSQIIEPEIDRSVHPDRIHRDKHYLDTVEEIWQGLKQYVD